MHIDPNTRLEGLDHHRGKHHGHMRKSAPHAAVELRQRARVDEDKVTLSGKARGHILTEDVDASFRASDKLKITDDQLKFAQRRSLEIRTEEVHAKTQTALKLKVEEDGDAELKFKASQHVKTADGYHAGYKVKGEVEFEDGQLESIEFSAKAHLHATELLGELG